MPIESRCTNCGKLLRVGDEYAGRKARCPECGQIYTVPTASTLATTAVDAPIAVEMDEPAPADGGFASQGAPSNDDNYQLMPPPPWYMRTPEGQIYGPVERDQLDHWMKEGRITDDCQLREGEQGLWQAASLVYPGLARPASHYAGAGQTTGGYYQGGSHPSTANYSASAYRTPHRGGMVLVLGLCSLMVCGLLGIFAWVMGNQDLQAMRAGRMDPEGMGMTQAGQIMGIIGTIIGIMQIGGALLMFLCIAAEGM